MTGNEDSNKKQHHVRLDDFFLSEYSMDIFEVLINNIVMHIPELDYNRKDPLNNKTEFEFLLDKQKHKVGYLVCETVNHGINIEFHELIEPGEKVIKDGEGNKLIDGWPAIIRYINSYLLLMKRIMSAVENKNLDFQPERAVQSLAIACGLGRERAVIKDKPTANEKNKGGRPKITDKEIEHYKKAQEWRDETPGRTIERAMNEIAHRDKIGSYRYDEVRTKAIRNRIRNDEKKRLGKYFTTP